MYMYILHEILYLNFIAKGKYFTSHIQCIYTLSNIAAIQIQKIRSVLTKFYLVKQLYMNFPVNMENATRLDNTRKGIIYHLF